MTNPFSIMLSKMPTSIFWNWILWLVFITSQQGIAQQPTYLKLQPHKLQWAQQVMKKAVQKKDSVLLAEAYYLFGKIYQESGDLRTATDFYLKSLKIQEKRGESYELVRLYVRLFNISEITLNYPEAKRYSALAINMADHVGTNKALLLALGTSTALYAKDWTLAKKENKFPKPNYDSLLIVLKKSEKLAQESSDEMEVVNVAIRLGWEFLRRNNSKSIDYFIKAIEISKKQKKPLIEFNTSIALAHAYIQFGKSEQAFQLITKAANIRKVMPLPLNSVGANTDLENIYFVYYKAKGDYKKALEHREKWFELERTKYLADREGALSRLSFDHEMDKKEIQLKTQKRELAINARNLQTQRIFIGVTLVLLIISSGTGIAFYRLSRKNQRISQHNAQLVKEQNHRVKNNLQVVSSLLSLHSNRLTDDHARQAVSESQLRVETMAILHRKLYDGDKLIVVSMPDFIKEVVEGVLQTYGFMDVETAFDIDNIELKPNHALSVGLIVNELCTNTCKYAVADAEESLISVSFKSSDNKINLIFIDNGTGFDLEKAQTQKSFGLKLIHLQVDQLYGSCEFRTDNGTMFQMQFKNR